MLEKVFKVTTNPLTIFETCRQTDSLYDTSFVKMNRAENIAFFRHAANICSTFYLSEVDK